MIRLIQKNLEDGVDPEEAAWATMVFLPRERGEYRGIGLVDVVWKVNAMVIKFCQKRSVAIHDALHGFRTGMDMGTTTLEAKLAQQLAGIAHEPLFQIFLNVRKAYDSLDRGWCMENLRGYGMGQNTARLIAHHLDNLIFSPKAKRFLGTPLDMGRGVTQGYPASPMIFNIVVDAVVIATLEVVCGLQ